MSSNDRCTVKVKSARSSQVQRSIDAQEFLKTILRKESSNPAYSFPSPNLPSFSSLDQQTTSTNRNEENCTDGSHLSLDNRVESILDVNSIYDRLETVQYLFDVVDHTNEDREIVQVAMNYFDRYILHILRSDIKSADGCLVGSRTSSSVGRLGCSTGFYTSGDHDVEVYLVEEHLDCPPSTPMKEWHHSVSEEDIDLVGETLVEGDTFSPSTDAPTTTSLLDNDRLSIVLLVCLDLAIKMYSPLSGDWKNVKHFHRYEYSDERSLSSPHYVGSNFYSIRRLLRNRVTKQELEETHQDLLKVLQFYLYPPTCTQVTRCVMDLFGSYILQGYFSDIMVTDVCIALLDQVFRSTMIQVELSMFDTRLSHLKSSVVTIASLENAFHQVLCSENIERCLRRYQCRYVYNEDYQSASHEKLNTVSPIPSKEEKIYSTGKVRTQTHHVLAIEMKHTLSYIIHDIMDFDSKDVEAMTKSRELLFQYWRENSPDMIICGSSRNQGPRQSR